MTLPAQSPVRRPEASWTAAASEARRRFSAATELRQTVAHGVSRGWVGHDARAAEQRQNRPVGDCRVGQSAAPLGLAPVLPSPPRLTPWATFSRCSAASCSLAFGISLELGTWDLRLASIGASSVLVLVQPLPPHPGPLPSGEGETYPASLYPARATTPSAGCLSPSPRGEGRGEGKRRVLAKHRSLVARRIRPHAIPHSAFRTPHFP